METIHQQLSIVKLYVKYSTFAIWRQQAFLFHSFISQTVLFSISEVVWDSWSLLLVFQGYSVLLQRVYAVVWSKPRISEVRCDTRNAADIFENRTGNVEQARRESYHSWDSVKRFWAWRLHCGNFYYMFYINVELIFYLDECIANCFSQCIVYNVFSPKNINALYTILWKYWRKSWMF